MKRPKGCPRHLMTYYYFPTEAPHTIDSGEKAYSFPCRYVIYILSAKYKTNQEKFSCNDGYWSNQTITNTGVPSTSRMTV